MRTTTLVSLLPITGLAQAAINITKSEQVDLATGTGELGWGALGLAFGYSAGVGFNFSDGGLSGGFNGAIPGQADGAIGGGYTINETTITLGLGGYLGSQGVDIAVVSDRTTGEVFVTVNGNKTVL